MNGLSERSLWLIEKYTGRWTYSNGKWWREWLVYRRDESGGATLEYYKS